MMFLIKGRSFELRVEWERLTPWRRTTWGLQQLMVKHNNIKKKHSLLTQSKFLHYIFLLISVPPCQSKFVLNILNLLKLYNCCILNEFANYFPDLYISILTVIILLYNFCFNNNFLKQSIPNSISQYFLNIYWAEKEITLISYSNKEVINIWLW